jgi:hypothetical protein
LFQADKRFKLKKGGASMAIQVARGKVGGGVACAQMLLTLFNKGFLECVALLESINPDHYK